MTMAATAVAYLRRVRSFSTLLYGPRESCDLTNMCVLINSQLKYQKDSGRVDWKTVRVLKNK